MPNSPLPDNKSRGPAPLSADKTTVARGPIGRRAGTGKVLFEVCSVSLGEVSEGAAFRLGSEGSAVFTRADRAVVWRGLQRGAAADNVVILLPV
jgi:hypothetical protein